MKPAGRRIQVILGGLLLIGPLAYGFWPSPVQVDVAKVVRGPLTVTVDEDGRTRVRERYIVASPLSGLLLRVGLHSGDAVKRGETILATIEASDPSLLDDRARAEAEARLKAAVTRREQAATVIERTRASEEVARKEFARAEQLSEKNAISVEALDAGRLKLHLAERDLRVAEFAQRIAEFEHDQARAALLRYSPRSTEQEELFRYDVRSPISGRVFRVFQESTTPVTPGTRLVEVGDPADLEVEVDVLSTDAVRIQPGAKMWLQHWGGDASLEARVRIVEPSAFTKVSALGIEEQRVWVIADLVTPSEERGNLGDGFRVEARIVTYEGADVLKVPAGALFRSRQEWAVYVVRGRRAVLQSVRVGATNGIETQILDGLQEGDPVILHPSDRVRPGTRVAPR
ncbi:MAG: HlyD family efflux transporter periplasmic adaptor subunit [Planctomycetaceae bacterium]|nr:HlyD family efflux transporter periplasmic adaptor subunit [Planctomycetaceae bacterium]